MIDCSKLENFLKELKRMCKYADNYDCNDMCEPCPISSHNNGAGIRCEEFWRLYPKKAVEILQKWSDDYPVE